ncbi:MAG: uroporphyrinogen decarboxylase family protein [Candidatus Hydromicrobium sp.]|nr:uroporphyrinogen decarboxylase family protein [Candidatus Hydromicrobium sp.]
MQKKLGVDQSIVICPVNLEKTIGSWWGLPLISKRENSKILGAWDIVFQEWEYPFGKYIEIHSSPLINATIDEIIKIKTPSLDSWDFEAYKKLLVKYQDFFVWLNMNGCFDFARFQRGSEQFFVDLALEPKNVEILLDKVNELAISFLEKCMEKIKWLVDGVYVGDDFGTQNGLVISPSMWRKYIKPRYKKLVSVVKKYGLKYCHHSCGGVRQIIPDMIELGFDVLNPVQPLAFGMDPYELGEEFGKDIAFYGGIDEQKTLPNGSVEDVKSEVLHRIKTLGKYGGYIVAPSHAFQPDTPIENVIAVYETVHGNKIS